VFKIVGLITTICFIPKPAN